MAKRFYEIFRAGNYPQGSFDADDIKQIAENYDPSFLETPITLDHQWGGPAYGWVDELKAEGERLLASFKDVQDHLKCMVATKAYKRHSVEIYNDIEDKGPYLKAVSLLGALVPQVKGMEPIEFSAFSENFPEDDSIVAELEEPIEPGDMSFSELLNAWLKVLEFDEGKLATQLGWDEDVIHDAAAGSYDEDLDEETVTEFCNILNTIHQSEFSAETADQLKDSIYQAIGFSENTPDSIEEDEPGNESDDQPKSFSDMSEAERAQAFNDMVTRTQELETKLEEERKDKSRFASENEQIKFNQRKSKFTSFLDKQVDGGKLLPKLKDKAVSLFAHLDGLGAEEDNDKTPLELFKEFINGLPEIDLDEHAKKKKKVQEFSTSQELADAATKYMEEQKKLGKHVSAAQAVTHVKKQGHNDE